MSTEALIAEARGFIAGSDPTNARTTLIRDLVDALEHAHTPTAAEREAARRLLNDVNPRHRQAPLSMLADDIRIVANAVLQRTEMPEPSDDEEIDPEMCKGCDEYNWECRCDDDISEPQGEPSDAQVAAAAREYHERGNGEGSFDRMANHVRVSLLFRMGCALRAAGGVR